MKQSESIKTLLQNFAKAQAEFPTLPKDKNGYNYRYTDLDTVISTVRPILAKYNIGFMQSLTTLESGKWAISTRIFNVDGEWIEDTTTLPDVSLAKGNAAQNIGASITYMKRYTLCAMLGISSDEDPDGKPDGNPDFNARNQQNQQSTAPAQKQNTKTARSAPGLKGGNDTKEEHEKINNLLGQKYPDGSPIFSKEECNKVGVWRKERTAQEVIKYLTEQLVERKKAKEPNADPIQEDIPYDSEKTMDAKTEQECMDIF